MRVVTTANSAYFPGVSVTVASLLARGGVPDVAEIDVLDTGLEDWQREFLRELTGSIRFHPIDGRLFNGWSQDYGGGYSTYARLLIAELVEGSRAMYLDADVLVRRSLAGLCNLEWPDGMLAWAAQEYHGDGSACALDYDCPFLPREEVAAYSYYNCGFMLVDLDGWRREKIAERALEAAIGHEKQLKAWDQTLLNYLLRGKIAALPGDTFRAADWRLPGDTAILHYISPRKPWNSYSPTEAFREWYKFHREHVKGPPPPGLGGCEYLRGWARSLRDDILVRLPPLRRAYIRDLERRHGEIHSRAYEEYLEIKRRG